MSVKSSVKRADNGEGAARVEARGSLAGVRLRRYGDSFPDERRSAEERRRAVAYGRARGRLS